METNPVCHVCKSSFGDEICCCVFPTPIICKGCETGHRQLKDGLHMFLPISALANVHSLQDLHKAREHLIHIRTAEEWLHANLADVKECGESIQAAYQELSKRLADFIADRMQALTQMEAGLQEAVSVTARELRSHVLEPGFEPAPGLGRLLWRYSNDTDPSTLQLFKWRVNILQERMDQLLNVSFWSTMPGLSHFDRKTDWSLAMQVPDIERLNTIQNSGTESQGQTSRLPIVVCVTPEFLRVFDCETETWREKTVYERQVQVDETSSYALLDSSSILCTGGGRVSNVPWNSTYRFFFNGRVQDLQVMTKPRRRHGIITFKGYAYVFGGWSVTREKSGEKLHLDQLLSLEKREWTQIPDMLSERSSFNPCAYHELIYLCGGAGCVNSEVFQPWDETYTALHFQLPESCETFAVVTDNQLFVISQEFGSRWPIVEKLTSTGHLKWNSWGSMVPFSKGNMVYLPYLLPDSGSVKRFNLTELDKIDFRLPDT